MPPSGTRLTGLFSLYTEVQCLVLLVHAEVELVRAPQVRAPLQVRVVVLKQCELSQREPSVRVAFASCLHGRFRVGVYSSIRVAVCTRPE